MCKYVLQFVIVLSHLWKPILVKWIFTFYHTKQRSKIAESEGSGGKPPNNWGITFIS